MADLYSSADTFEGEPKASPGYGGEEPTDTSGGTALLPKDFFPEPPEPGKMCSVRVVRVEDDQVEVEYAHNEGEETPEQQAEETAQAQAPAGMGMEAMMQ